MRTCRIQRCDGRRAPRRRGKGCHAPHGNRVGGLHGMRCQGSHQRGGRVVAERDVRSDSGSLVSAEASGRDRGDLRQHRGRRDRDGFGSADLQTRPMSRLMHQHRLGQPRRSGECPCSEPGRSHAGAAHRRGAHPPPRKADHRDRHACAEHHPARGAHQRDQHHRAHQRAPPQQRHGVGGAQRNRRSDCSVGCHGCAPHHADHTQRLAQPQRQHMVAAQGQVDAGECVRQVSPGRVRCHASALSPNAAANALSARATPAGSEAAWRAAVPSALPSTVRTTTAPTTTVTAVTAAMLTRRESRLRSLAIGFRMRTISS